MPGVSYGSQASWGLVVGGVSGVLGCYEWPGNDGVMCCVSLLSRLVWVEAEAKRCNMTCDILSSLYVPWSVQT